MLLREENQQDGKSMSSWRFLLSSQDRTDISEEKEDKSNNFIAVITELRKVFVFEPCSVVSPFLSRSFTISRGDIGNYDDVYIMDEKTGTQTVSFKSPRSTMKVRIKAIFTRFQVLRATYLIIKTVWYPQESNTLLDVGVRDKYEPAEQKIRA